MVITARLIFTAFFLLLMVIGMIGLKIHHSRVKKDPEYEQKIRERMIEAQRKREEEAELDNYMGGNSNAEDEYDN